MVGLAESGELQHRLSQGGLGQGALSLFHSFSVSLSLVLSVFLCPRRGSICGRLTYNLPLGYLQGGFLITPPSRVSQVLGQDSRYDCFECQQNRFRCVSSSLLLSSLALSDTKVYEP